MPKSDTEIVASVRRAVAARVGPERFRLWFGSRTQWQLHDGSLSISAPSRFLTDWLRTSFREQIEGACVEVLGTCPAIQFHVDSALPEASPEGKVAAAGGAAASPQAIAPEAPPKRPGPEGARRFLDLESFVAGHSNRVARTTAQLVVEYPGRFSPFLVHGPSSCGKTHLLQGIWTAVRRRGISAVYVTAEQFTTQYLEALRGAGLPSFRRKVRQVDALLVDDLHFFLGKRSTLVELLYTTDTLMREQKQVVFAADRPVSELQGLGREFLSRLSSGQVCGIDPPEQATRLGIVAQMAKRLQLSVPEKVQQFIASRLTSHARELSGALCRLQATSQALSRPITLGLAEEALAEMIRHSGRVVRLGDIQKAVCDAFGLEPDSLKSDRKTKRVSHPRMLAMWLARKHTRAALVEIGHFFGHRSHSTVIAAQKRVDRWLAAGTHVDLADRAWSLDEAIRKVEGMLLAG